jgi:hypothetical protein
MVFAHQDGSSAEKTANKPTDFATVFIHISVTLMHFYVLKNNFAPGFADQTQYKFYRNDYWSSVFALHIRLTLKEITGRSSWQLTVQVLNPKYVHIFLLSLQPSS